MLVGFQATWYACKSFGQTPSRHCIVSTALNNYRPHKKMYLPSFFRETVPELNLPILKATKDYFCQYCQKVILVTKKDA